MSGEVLCYGEALVVVAPDPPAPLARRPACRLAPAGAEFNVACHLAALGHPTQWAGALGDDPFGAIILDEARSRAVGTELVSIDHGRPTGVYFKSPGRSGTRVHYYRSGSALAALDVRRLPMQTPPTVVHVTGITPALSDTARRSTRALMDGSLFPHALVSFDVNFRPALWPDRETARTVLLELAQTADVVFVGRDEAEAVWGARTADEIRALIDRPAHLVVKDGDVVATEFAPSGTTSVVPPEVAVSEPVGAGDAFAAGWLSGHLAGAGPVRRLRLGHLLASQALQQAGDLFDMPGDDAIARLLAIDPSCWPDSVTGVDRTCSRDAG